ncbi:MAG: hypothetical protein CMI85_05485 [Candidatus Pelagibacter sp.]|nr:hypothetical protein [Candidatus Pelagibacter sp.]|tara:strand:- start:782 stop:979 length:198 start_codon:yes stop_codon:yes gene_type:complete
MNYEEFLAKLEEYYIDLSEVQEALGLTDDEIKSWEESEEMVPDEAIDFLNSEIEKRSADKLETEE